MHIEEIIDKRRNRDVPSAEERSEYLDEYIKVYCEMKNINSEGLDAHQLEFIEDELRAECKRFSRPKGLQRNRFNWI